MAPLGQRAAQRSRRRSAPRSGGRCVASAWSAAPATFRGRAAPPSEPTNSSCNPPRLGTRRVLCRVACYRAVAGRTGARSADRPTHSRELRAGLSPAAGFAGQCHVAARSRCLWRLRPIGRTVGRMSASEAMSWASLITVLASVGTRRVELTAWWDRAMLDVYEERPLPPSWRLHHRLRLRQRLGLRSFDLA
jgi:hypothetical protein